MNEAEIPQDFTISNLEFVSREESFTYDALDRLSTASASGGASGLYNETYTYNTSSGNLELKAGVSLQYNDTAHKHAVTNAGTNTYTYDTNGNQTTRVVNGQTYTLGYDAENRLISVSGAATASFVYDGDGNRVKSTVSNVTTTFVGNYYELTGSQVTKYYFAGTQRVAMRKYTIPQAMTVEYLLGDHLGSTSITTDNTSAKVSEIRYKPWGEIRYSWTSGVATTPSYRLTNYTFTGQFSYMDDPTTTGTTEGFGLMFYNARWYDPYLNHFTQPDSIVPNLYNPQDWDRYSYVRNNPIKYADPTGHDSWWCKTASCSYGSYNRLNYSAAGELAYIKASLLQDYGITLADGGTDHPAYKSGTSGRNWNLRNARVMDGGLYQINSVLNGKLKQIIGSSTFTLNSHPNTMVIEGVLTDTSGYHLGYTTGTNVDFYTNSTVQFQNLYHEFGHVLDNSPGYKDSFSGALQKLQNPSFLDSNSTNINSAALAHPTVFDPYTWNNKAKAIQHPNPDADDRYTENWADIFANYMSGNIDTSDPFGPGPDMYKFVTDVLP